LQGLAETIGRRQAQREWEQFRKQSDFIETSNLAQKKAVEEHNAKVKHVIRDNPCLSVASFMLFCGTLMKNSF